MIDVSRYRNQLDEIGECDFEGTTEEKLLFFQDAYNKSYAIALAVVEAVEEANGTGIPQAEALPIS